MPLQNEWGRWVTRGNTRCKKHWLLEDKQKKNWLNLSYYKRFNNCTSSQMELVQSWGLGHSSLQFWSICEPNGWNTLKPAKELILFKRGLGCTRTQIHTIVTTNVVLISILCIFHIGKGLNLFFNSIFWVPIWYQ